MGLQTSTTAITSDGPAGILVRYHLHCPNTNALVILGSEVISIDGLCPVFNVSPNPNIFQNYFGIEFHHKDHGYVRAISSYEFIQCFEFIDRITYCLSHPTYKFALDAVMPSRTSAWLLEQIHSIFHTFVTQTVKYFCQTNLLSQLPPFRHLSTVQSAFISHHKNNGFKHTPMTLR